MTAYVLFKTKREDGGGFERKKAKRDKGGRNDIASGGLPSSDEELKAAAKRDKKVFTQIEVYINTMLFEFGFGFRVRVK